jgi:hypothetical protein
MQIQSGKLYKNKTWLYLYPCLNSYGKELKSHLNSFFKLAVGISDHNIEIKNERNNLYILFDLNPSSNVSKDLPKYRENFDKFLEWLRYQYYYETDYVFESLEGEEKHMIVLQIPPQHDTTIFNFIKGYYSKMYLEKDLNTYFMLSTTMKDKTAEKNYNERVKQVRSILTKDAKYTIEFVKIVNEKFGTEIIVEDYKGAELDFPPVIEEETFNFE